ncbi:hypothetical protein B296_00028435, partial [Ensete ventricosum]
WNSKYEMFASYFHYCRLLRFEDKPDYAYLKRLFRGAEVRANGRLVMDSSNRAQVPPPAENVGSLLKQKAPIGNDLPASGDAMFSSSTFLGRSSGSSRRVAVSGSRDLFGTEADQSRSRTAEASPGTFRKVSNAQRSPISSADHRHTSSRRNISTIKNYESALKGMEALNFDSNERNQL